MEAGKLDRKIVIEQKSVSRDDVGGENISWTTYKTIWSGFSAKRNTEGVQSGQETASRIVEFIFRYQDAPAVDEAMRISYNSQYYYIVGIQELGRQDTIKAITTTKI